MNRRNRIKSTCVKRMAAQQAPNCQHSASPRPVITESLFCIIRTAWIKPARRCRDGTDADAVEADHCNRDLAHGSTGSYRVLWWAGHYTPKQLLAQVVPLFFRNSPEIPADNDDDIDTRQVGSNVTKSLPKLPANPVPANRVPGILSRDRHAEASSSRLIRNVERQQPTRAG